MRQTLSLLLVCLSLPVGAAAQAPTATITGPIPATSPPGEPSPRFRLLDVGD